jgi:hypothetical protein
MSGAVLGAVSYMVVGAVFGGAGLAGDTNTTENSLQDSTQTAGTVAVETAVPVGAQYLAEARTAFAAWEGSAIVLVQQGEQVQQNSLLIGDATWQSDTRDAVGAFQQAVQQLRQLPATPSGYENVGTAIAELIRVSDTLVSDVNALLGGDFSVGFRLEGDLERGMAAHGAVQQALQSAPPG